MNPAPAEVEAVRADVLISVAAGGVIGALSRYGLGQLWPHGPGSFPWTTLLINSSGALLIGVLLGELTRHPCAHRLWRPLLGVGLLGGYTTFSTFTVDTVLLVDHARPGAAGAYVALTLVTAALAVRAGAAAVALRQRRQWPEDPEVGA